MNIIGSRTARISLVVFLLSLTSICASAMQIGPVIRTDGGGLHVGGTNIGGSAPLRPVGNFFARMGGELRKSAQDPFGYKKKAQELEDEGINFAKSTYTAIVKEVHFVTAAVCLTIGFCFATFLFRRRSSGPVTA